MRYLLVFLGLFVTVPVLAGSCPVPGSTGETAWMCQSRIAGKVPIVGRFHHCSVLICPAGVCPIVIGPDGKPMTNPGCACYGTQPWQEKFLRETAARVGVRCQSSLLPSHEVTARITSHSRQWRLWYNCQHAAAEATGYAGCACSPEANWFRRVLIWLHLATETSSP